MAGAQGSAWYCNQKPPLHFYGFSVIPKEGSFDKLPFRMNKTIQQLADTAQKSPKLIIGLMSGTSLDGLDIALCEIQGKGKSTKAELLNFESIPYDPTFKRRLKTITSVPKASLEEVTLLHSFLGHYHGELILQALDQWGVDHSKVDCIASHGQTIYHAPKRQHNHPGMPNATLQIGDGDHIAHKTGILTISDFRQKHTAAGGEGAPMVSFVDRILYTDDTEERILLNIGGIANFTYLPAKKNDSQKTITTDTGPGNTLIDTAVQQYFSRDYDRDGAIARIGQVNRKGLEALKGDPYFHKSLPKTTGPEVFNLRWVDELLYDAGVTDIAPRDLVATLTRLSAETIADGINNILDNDQQPIIYVSGGGIHNPVMWDWIEELLPQCEIKNFSTIGFDPDAKEAVLFAVLANEMLSGDGFSIDAHDPRSEKINFGKISFPA
jgi:anhydro-N-acetylmuramic acid kinase